MLWLSDFSDSDSDWSSIEKNQPLQCSSNDTFSNLNQKAVTQKRSRKKRMAIPVSTPKIPSFVQDANGSVTLFSPVPGHQSFYSEESNSELKSCCKLFSIKIRTINYCYIFVY